MIIDMHKYLIYGSKSDMDRFFSLAQRAGFIEFIGLSHKKALEMPENAKTIIAAIKILKTHIVHPEAPYQPKLDPVRLAEHIVKLQGEWEKLAEEERLLNIEIARISPYGPFSKSDIDQIAKEGKRVLQFFCMKSEKANEFVLPPEVIYITTEYDLDYFLAINKEPVKYPNMIEIVIDRSLKELKDRLQIVKNEKDAIEKEIRDLTSSVYYLQRGLNDYLNEYHLDLAKRDTLAPLGQALFVIEAWVPENKVKALYGLLSGVHVDIERIAIEPNDRVPTYMENKGAKRIGEDLVHIYETPSPTDKDPSLWVLIFFSLFFAMIVSDAGYGLIYLCFGLFLKWKTKKALAPMRRFTKLILMASTACIIWGILTLSFFGIHISPDHPLTKYSAVQYLEERKAEYHMHMRDDVYDEYVKEYPKVVEARTGREFLIKASKEAEGKIEYGAQEEFYNNILLEFSLFLGFIHIALSFMRYCLRNWTAFGWILFMIGGYLYFPYFLDATSFVNFMGILSKPMAYAIGKPLLFFGLGAVFVIALLQKKKWGAFHELTNAIQVFADVLSYLRLYALALAGMIMAGVFNDLGIKAGILGGILIILIGHLVNLNLAIMSGVIHGLRLNFLEWYHYSFEGGGRPFNPLRIRK